VNNYQYCAEFAVRLIGGNAGVAKVLDFGCGAGHIVELLRKAGISAFGCEAFYGGGAARIPDELSGFILAMQGNVIPFPACTFDVVINNQVMEHVEDIDAALSEIHRVLKPGGTLLSLFPDKSVWHEGHCGVPLLHRFPKQSTFRIYYALLWRSIGFGKFTEGKSRLEWSKDFCTWLDQWTEYRSYEAIANAYAKYFSPMQHIEDHWLESRVGPIARPFPAPLKRLFVNKLAGMVFTCVKSPRIGLPNGPHVPLFQTIQDPRNQPVARARSDDPPRSSR
jgi:SAM-dependent methyltransferase